VAMDECTKGEVLGCRSLRGGHIVQEFLGRAADVLGIIKGIMGKKMGKDK